MQQVAISKEKVPEFLALLAREYRVMAPYETSPGDVVFDDFDAGAKIAYEFVNSLLPPKSLFFPRLECLFEIDGATDPTLEQPPEEQPLAVFGMRSCDATGLGFLERFFSQRGFDDETITRRIQASLRMTSACTDPGPDCFCVCCDGGPFLLTGFDLQFVDLGETLVAEMGTAQGRLAVERAGELFSPATAAEIEAKERRIEAVDAGFRRRSYISQGTKAISLGRVASDSWDAWASDCQGCGGCCFVCPTCSCFTVNDTEDRPGHFRRERAWDACLYEGFTREASGHNPRAAASERVKRRFFHKMSYQYVEVMGRHGCVGCGRCVTTCMGELDISTLLERIRDERE